MHLTEETYRNTSDGSEAIAIVGMSLRVPGADSLETFWENLKEGRETITFFSDDELRRAGVNEATLADPDYVKAMGRLENVEMFDARFFDMTPKEAEILDPQHRILMEGVWRALEDAAIDPERYPGRIGLYAGVGFNSYLIHHILSNPELLESAGAWQLSLNNDKDFAPTRISYKFNLQGPAVSINTACSTSLVSTVMAAQSLLAYQCDTAIAGGCSIHLSQDQGYHFMRGGTVSPDGHCRPFDVNAAGTVDGNGTAVVVLKRLDDAISDGDSIHAVLRGFAVNNDGSLKVGYTAPSVSGQSDVILEALEMAEIEPSQVHYVETHGTGTELGDSVEISALGEAFSGTSAGAQSCIIGSVKSNLGHLDTAAGVTGLIKTVLALQHGEIPPTCHFTSPNPTLGLEKGPFHVNNKLIPWPKTGSDAKIAGVSSFGIGGTNAHVIIEEVIQDRVDLSSKETARSLVLLPLAAKTEDLLPVMAQELAAHIDSHPEQSLEDIAWTLQAGRRHFGFRNFVVVDAGDRVACIKKLGALSGAFDKDVTMASDADDARSSNGTDNANGQAKETRLADEAGQVEKSGLAEKTELNKAGKLWIDGNEIDWEQLCGKKMRVAIPGHPFKRERYWIESGSGLMSASGATNPLNSSGNRVEGITNGANGASIGQADDLTKATTKQPLIDNWFYLPGGRRILPSRARIAPGSRWLLVSDDTGLAGNVAGELQSDGAEAILVRHEKTSGENTTGNISGSLKKGFALDTTDEASWDALFNTLGEWKPQQILHFGLYVAEESPSESTEPESSLSDTQWSSMQQRAFDGLMSLGQAMGRHFFSEETGITLLANHILGMGTTGSNNYVNPEKVTALGPLRVIPQEYPNISTRAVDIDGAVRLPLLVAEIADINGPSSVILKGGDRWVEAFEPVVIGDESAGQSRPSTAPSRLREKGVYMITGGLGNIGLTLANYLAETVSARLVLVSRSSFPERSTWKSLLKKTDTSPRLQQQIQQLLNVEATGGDVLICRADVSDEKAMQQVFSEAEKKFKDLNGVIHAAGLVGEQSFVTLNDARTAEGKEANYRQFPSKTVGCEVLGKLLENRSFDFCLVCSSLSPLLGGLGFSAYASTNLYADAFVEAQNRHQPGKWLGVNWEGWMFGEDELPENAGTSSAFELGMSASEGEEVFARIMDQPYLERIVISSGDLRRRLSQWTGKRQMTEEQSSSGESHARPDYIGAYTAPSTDTEEKLVLLWGKLLGIEGIGIHDSFFELGGNSLLLTQLVAMIRRTFQAELALSAMFEQPTVAAIAAQIDGVESVESEAEEREEGFL